MEKTELRVLIKHCFLMGKNTVQAQLCLEKGYPDSVPLKTTICRSYADFKRGRTDTNGAERSGRPNDAVIPVNMKKVLKVVMDNRKGKLHEISDIVKVSFGSVFTILREHLCMKKLF